MSNSNSEKKEKAISLAQRWGAGKIVIGSEFKLKDSERILTLLECDGYPYGKFVFNDGEDFDIGKYFDCFFIELEKSIEEEKDFWDILDDKINPKKSNGEDLNPSPIRKSFADIQKNESFHDFAYYDVTDIIDTILKDQSKPINNNLSKKVYDYMLYNNFPFFTKEKLWVMFNNCIFEPTNDKSILKVKKDNEVVGFLVEDSNKYVFAPRNKNLKDEYSFEENNSTGFFYTAESYLDVALAAIEKYKKEFVTIFHSDSEKNKESLGYQADSTIKTLLAFSCECYLKALLMNKDKSLKDIKGLGHGLSELYTSLDDDEIGKVFDYMERHGYNITKSMYQSIYETNDLTEKFMLDLARVDDAFIDSRYCAENDKNTDYNFLYQFALALRNCSKKEFMIASPFTDSIESKIGKK